MSLSGCRLTKHMQSVRDFAEIVPPQRARFVRVKPLSYGIIPDWHPGKGGDAWIFVDEIVIE